MRLSPLTVQRAQQFIKRNTINIFTKSDVLLAQLFIKHKLQPRFCELWLCVKSAFGDPQNLFGRTSGHREFKEFYSFQIEYCGIIIDIHFGYSFFALYK